MLRRSNFVVISTLLLSFGAFSSACGSEDGDTGAAFGPTGGETDDSAASSSSTAGESSSTSSSTGGDGDGDGSGDGDGDSTGSETSDGTDSSSSGPLLDVGGMETTGMPTEGGSGDECQKIDFLFVIDNSNSMSDEQALLVSAFPDFINAIETTLPDATDFHIGVTKTDIHGFDNNPTPDPSNPCPYVMGGLISSSTPVDEKTGTGPSCNFASGENWMTSGPTLGTEFACAAAVGTDGNTGETQAEATIAALSGANTQAGGCSNGFLRDDALLVVIVISDEDDDWSPPDADAATNAAAWSTAVADAKGGIESNVVFLLLSGGSPKWPACGDLDLQNNTGADDSPKLTAWANSFTNVELGNVCEMGYANYLAQVIGTIETACDEFIPVD